MATVGIPSVVGEQLGGDAAAAGDWSFLSTTPSWLLAVGVSISASAMTVTGFVIQKRALHDADASRWPRVGDVVLSPGWVTGFLITAIFPVLGDLVAYSLAPLSLTAPLSGISVVLNLVIAPRVLKEELQRFPDIPATIFILLGCVMTTAFGDHDRTAPYGAEKLLVLSYRPAFFWGSTLGWFIGFIVWNQQRKLRYEIEKLAAEQPQNPHLPHVLLPALSASLSGAMANVGLKGVGELLRNHSPNVQAVLCALVVAPSAVMQVNFINRGLFLYPQSVFISVYAALLVLTNTMYGALFYEEYVPLLASRSRLSFFAAGCVLIMMGIWLFRWRRPASSSSVRKAEEEIGLLNMDNFADHDGQSVPLCPRRSTFNEEFSDNDNRPRLRNYLEEDGM